MVEGGGFEPPKAEPSDLQSDPFDHSGTPPKCKPAIVLQVLVAVNSIEHRKWHVTAKILATGTGCRPAAACGFERIGYRYTGNT
jgi:hypothetical protein